MNNMMLAQLMKDLQVGFCWLNIEQEGRQQRDIPRNTSVACMAMSSWDFFAAQWKNRIRIKSSQFIIYINGIWLVATYAMWYIMYTAAVSMRTTKRIQHLPIRTRQDLWNACMQSFSISRQLLMAERGDDLVVEIFAFSQCEEPYSVSHLTVFFLLIFSNDDYYLFHWWFHHTSNFNYIETRENFAFY